MEQSVVAADPPREPAAGAAVVDLMCNPTAVVVVGASADPAKISSRALKFLIRYGYAGDIQVVHPRAQEVMGRRCYRSIAELPRIARRAAIINLPADQVPAAVAELEHNDVGFAVIVGSGFEAKDSGARRELVSVLSEPGFTMRVLGPNCVGSMSVANGVHLNFSSVIDQQVPLRGRVALVTQSGALGNAILTSLFARGVGLAHWFSTGNEFDLGALELTTGLLHREDVDTVGLFLEGITDAAWLTRLALELRGSDKRVIVMKAARTSAGRSAAGGHTGRNVGNSDVTSAALAEAGMIEVPGLAELCDALVVRSACGPLPSATRIGVVSVSGASGVVAADAAASSTSIVLGALRSDRAVALSRSIDSRLVATNPLDVPFLNETAVFADAVTAYRNAADFDVTVAVASKLAHDHVELATKLDRDNSGPVVLCHVCEDDVVDPQTATLLAKRRVAVVPTVERAIAALSRLAPPQLSTSHAVTNVDNPQPILGLEDAIRILPGLSWAQWEHVNSQRDALRVAATYGYPVVLKAAGRTIAHRSEIGAVRVVGSESELGQIFSELAALCAAHGDIVVVQQFAPPGAEVLIAAADHPEVGPYAVVRPGGVLTELMSTQVILVRAWDGGTRRRLVQDSDVGRWLSGYRRGTVFDLDAVLTIVDTVLEAVFGGKASFLELNPVFVHEAGATVVDAFGSSAAVDPITQPDRYQPTLDRL